MIYKIILSSGPAVPVESEEALEKILGEINAGKKLILTKHGVINSSFVVSIVVHRELMEEVAETLRMGGSTREGAEARAIGASPFVKLLGNKMPELGNGK